MNTAESIPDLRSGATSAGHQETAVALRALAARCDTMCLSSGAQLGDAVPGLYDLSSRFAVLSEMLLTESGIKPAESLESVARDIRAIGGALTAEREAAAVLIELNAVLSRRIIGLDEDVRFLSAVVSNVKIEVATLHEGEHRLEGFADNLKQLAAKSESTVHAFQDTHERLLKQLQRTATAQSAFISAHGTKFVTASEEISASLEAVSDRNKGVSAIAAEIGTLTQRIGTQIGQCVVALQVGDSTRQRLEHAGEALAIVADFTSGVGSKKDLADQETCAPDRVYALQTIQISEATREFAAEVGTVRHLVERIIDASRALNDKSFALTSSPGDASRSFVGELEAKLAVVGHLLDQCRVSRKLVDETAGKVVASVVDLQGLAQKVAAMATDMMIIGTNAVVTSYRLGTKGIPLSVISQHLRSHAVNVTEGVKLVAPALEKVLDAAQQFSAVREGQDAGSMEGLAKRITDALAAFQDGDRAVAEVRDRLKAEVGVVDGALRKAKDAMGDIDHIEVQLRDIENAVGNLASESLAAPDEQGTFPADLDRLLRALYTMEAERVIHEKAFPHPTAEVPIPPSAPEASLWL